ncbi:MAG: hypothetical protein AB1626_01825 [Candidatus Micrarchaeota archaeon]
MKTLRLLIAAAVACGAAALSGDAVLAGAAGGAALLWPDPQKPEQREEKPQRLSF